MIGIKKKLSIFIFIIISVCANSQDEGREMTLSLADYYYANRQYKAAIKEYQRYLFYTGTEETEVLLKVAGGLYELGYYDLALQYYDQVYFLSDKPSEKFLTRFAEINYHIIRSEYKNALVLLYSAETEFYELYPDVINFLFAVCFYGLEDFEQSESRFLNITADDPSATLQIRKIFSDEKKFYRPNPRVIYWSSIFVPGLGQILTGEIKEGLNSFLLVGGIGVAAVFVGLNYSAWDAIFTVLPWYQRYLLGGSDKAEKYAIQKRKRNLNKFYQEILEVLEPYRENFEITDPHLVP